MARFQFRLETLLKLRASVRSQRRLELAQAFEAEKRLRQQMDYLALERNATRKRSQVAAGPGQVSVDLLLDTHRYGIVLQARVQQLEGQRDRVREEIERRRQALAKADRDVRVLEKLREKLRGQHQAELAKREAKVLDEIAQRHVRQARP